MRDIKGYEGLYAVTKDGRVWSYPKENALGPLEGRWLKLVDSRGYQVVKLHGNGKKKTELVHRLVCGAFLDNPENKPPLNHKNNIRHDNRLENLEWCTPKENINHAQRIGVMPMKPPKHRWDYESLIVYVEYWIYRRAMVNAINEKDPVVLIERWENRKDDSNGKNE